MDNAGGHGKRAAREEYTRRLRDEYNIIILELIVESGGDNITVEDRRGRRNMVVADPE
jgi:hypothetical protein